MIGTEVNHDDDEERDTREMVCWEMKDYVCGGGKEGINTVVKHCEIVSNSFIMGSSTMAMNKCINELNRHDGFYRTRHFKDLQLGKRYRVLDGIMRDLTYGGRIMLVVRDEHAPNDDEDEGKFAIFMGATLSEVTRVKALTDGLSHKGQKLFIWLQRIRDEDKEKATPIWKFSDKDDIVAAVAAAPIRTRRDPMLGAVPHPPPPRSPSHNLLVGDDVDEPIYAEVD